MRGMPVMADGGDPDTWQPEPCPRCGAEQVFSGEWHNVTRLGDGCPVVMPGRVWCSDRLCGRVCKVCRREPGDVHGPDCGPLMVDKLDRPHIITKEDCR